MSLTIDTYHRGEIFSAALVGSANTPETSAHVSLRNALVHFLLQILTGNLFKRVKRLEHFYLLYNFTVTPSAGEPTHKCLAVSASAFPSSARHLLCVYRNREVSGPGVGAINARHSHMRILHSSDRLYVQSGTFYVPRTTRGIRIPAENSPDARGIFIVGGFAPCWRRFISASLRSSNLTALSPWTALVSLA